MAPEKRCYYDILEIPRDAEDKTIKKAHRKLVLKYHPDKNFGDEDAAKEFRLVQEAYECLSDPSERKWYDEHRESILRGGHGFGGDEAYQGEGFIFDVTPYHFAGCYDGYGDGEGGFFDVYSKVFESIIEGEIKGWVSEGNIDEQKMPNIHLKDVSFGNGSTDWKDVSKFYNSWESFTSCLSFAWVDKYDPREAESRYIRRRIDDENKKARKVAKRERNDDVTNLVAFVRKKDPRVKAAKERAETERLLREKERKEEALRKKAEAAVAREAWLAEREKELLEQESSDVNAGRVRLADLDDSDEEYYYKKKGKKGKKMKRKSKHSQQPSDSEENIDVPEETEGGDTEIVNDTEINQDCNEDGTDIVEEMLAQDLAEVEFDEHSIEDSSEEELEIFKCECCRKTFKSVKQLQNHENSKKHKEAYKKWLEK